MDALRFSVLPKSTKILDFPRTASDNDILHTAGRKYQRKHNISNIGCVGHPGNEHTGYNKGGFDLHNGQGNTKAGSDSDIPDKSGKVPPKHWRKTPVHLFMKDASRVDVDNKTNVAAQRCVVNNAFEVKVNNETKTVLEYDRNCPESKTGHDEKSKSDYVNNPLPQRPSLLSRRDLENENNISDVTDEELETLPDLDYPSKHSRCFKSNDVHPILAPANLHGGHNSLSDVGNEKLQQLPELETPSRARIISQTSNKNIGQEKHSSPKVVPVNKYKRIHQLKRSISSIESDEECTSFFGSIRNRNVRMDMDNEDIDEEAGQELLYFSAAMSVTSHTRCPYPPRCEPSLKLNRAYSAESFMKRRESDNIYSQKSSRKNSSLPGSYDDKQDTTGDRLQIRRGALAEPEKMLISQELRERTERGVEKRKTFMRKVSQFFNLHLRLNLEEDLI